MPEPRTSDRPTGNDVVVGVDGVSGRAWLQSADVILGGAPDRAGAVRWAAGVLRRFPGCAVAGVRHRGGRWLLLVARSGERLEAGATTAPGLSPADVERVARTAYLRWVRPSRVSGGDGS
jgi:hypothetical protein